MHPAIFALATLSVSLNAMAQIALRKTMLGMGALPTAMPEALRFGALLVVNPWFLLGMLSYAVSVGIWLLVLAKAEVSLAYPLLSIGYLITAAAGYFFLGENVGPMRLSGLALICVGIVLVSRSA